MPKSKGSVFRSFISNDRVKRIFDQRSFVMAALERDPLILQFASTALKADKELVLCAVNRSWKALQYAASELQSHLEVATLALAQNPLALQFTASNIKGNRDMVMDAVKKDPQTLKFASRKLQADDVISATAYAAYVTQQCNLSRRGRLIGIR